MACSRAFDAVEGDLLPADSSANGNRAAGEEVEGGAVGLGVHAEGADDAQLLVDEVVGVEGGGGLAPGAGDDEGARRRG